jgi:hypothetical protein
MVSLYRFALRGDLVLVGPIAGVAGRTGDEVAVTTFY